MLLLAKPAPGIRNKDRLLRHELHRPRVLARNNLSEQVGSEGIAGIAARALKDDPDAGEQLRRYEKALMRVEQAKAAQAELEKMYVDASKAIMEDVSKEAEEQERTKAEILADAEVKAAEKLVLAAQLKLREAERDQQTWGATALKDLEKAESVKAALLSAVAGTAVAAPLVFLQSPAGAAPLSLLAIVGSCFLFGVTFRYALRSDLDNVQLKAGVVAAFTAVRSLSAFDILQLNGAGEALQPQLLTNAITYGLESAIVFASCAAALEAGFRQGLVQLYGQVTADE